VFSLVVQLLELVLQAMLIVSLCSIGLFNGVFFNVLPIQSILLVLFPWCYLCSFDPVGGDSLVLLVTKLIGNSSIPLIDSYESNNLVGWRLRVVW
jgi:hypothetical protein